MLAFSPVRNAHALLLVSQRSSEEPASRPESQHAIERTFRTEVRSQPNSASLKERRCGHERKSGAGYRGNEGLICFFLYNSPIFFPKLIRSSSLTESLEISKALCWILDATERHKSYDSNHSHGYGRLN